MKNKNNLITLIIGIIIGISVMGIVICFTVNKLGLVDKVYTSKVNESTEGLKDSAVAVGDLEKYQVSEKITTNEKVKTTKKEPVASKKEESKVIAKKQEEKKEVTIKKENSQSFEVQTQKSKEEVSNVVIVFAEKVENEIMTEENINNALKKAKQEFIKLIDFIFYGTEIDGYTFNDLTEQAKLQLMSIAIRIDTKLEEYKPGYKDQIQLKIDDVQNGLTIKYLEVADKICTKMGTVACDQAKQDLLVLKENVNLTIDWLSVIASNGLSSLDSWYRIFKKEN